MLTAVVGAPCRGVLQAEVRSEIHNRDLDLGGVLGRL